MTSHVKGFYRCTVESFYYLILFSFIFDVHLGLRAGYLLWRKLETPILQRTAMKETDVKLYPRIKKPDVNKPSEFCFLLVIGINFFFQTVLQTMVFFQVLKDIIISNLNFYYKQFLR
jgi:hypothetical protein